MVTEEKTLKFEKYKAGNPKAPTKPKVSIVDDDENMHCLLRDLGKAGHFHMLDAFLDPTSALKSLPQNPPDVLFMDIRLPGISGIECAHKLKTLLPDLQIIMLTSFPDGPSFFRSLMAGASGFLGKPFTTTELMEAIDSATRGEYVLGAVTSQYLVHLFRQFKTLAAESTLTEREEQVLSCVFQGMSDKEIASNLGIGTATVHTHLHRLFDKLGVHSRKSVVNKFLSATGHLINSPAINAG